MARINSRKKGSKNERNLTKLFKTWCKKEFARTPSSGGLNWKNSNAVGDIVCTTEGHFFPFAIEAKNHREINFQHLLYLDTSDIMKFWEQCKGDADKGAQKKIPILFMRYNGMPRDLHFVMMRYEVWIIMRDKLLAAPRTLSLHTNDENLIILLSTDLFRLRYKDCRKRLKNSPLWPRKK